MPKHYVAHALHTSFQTSTAGAEASGK